MGDFMLLHDSETVSKRAWKPMAFVQHDGGQREFNIQTFLRLSQWYSTFLVPVPTDVISLHLCIRKVVGL
jgi:hypothetical protein